MITRLLSRASDRCIRRSLARLAAILAVIAFGPLGVQSAATAAACATLGTESVWTDKAHYSTDEAVVLSGQGFAASCTVDVKVAGPGGVLHQDTATTDPLGGLTYTYLAGDRAGEYAIDLVDLSGEPLTGAAFTIGPAVTLDKGDYRNGETVEVSGAGFTPYSEFVVRITRPDGSVVRGDGTRTAGSDLVTTDAGGQLAYGYVITDGVVADYLVDVLGQDGGALASTSFTDSALFVKNLGTATSTGGTSLTLTVSGTVAAGNSIVVAFSAGNANRPVTCSDSRGNGYTTDAEAVNGAGGSVSICSTHQVPAGKVLVAGVDTITVTFPGGGSKRSMSANEFSGLDASPVDKKQTCTGSNNSPSTAASGCQFTDLTSQAEEVVFGAFWFNGTNNSSFSAGSGTCTGTPTGTYTLTNTPLGNGTDDSVPLATEYRIATSQGSYAACGALTIANQWAAALVTYKTAAVDLGQIKIVKNTVGGNGTFGFTVSGASSASPSVTTSGGTGETTITVAAGTYSIGEGTLAAGWVGTGASCDSGTPASFTVPVGGLVTCTFTNTAQGKIRINKTAIGGNATFGFSISGPSASTPSIATTAGSGTTGLITVTAGAYSVTEGALPASWVATAASCDSGTPASFTVPIGGTVTCSFTNTAQGKIQIDKTAIGGNATFGFSISGPSASTPSIATAGGSGTTGLITVTAGTYAVTESTVPTGWGLTTSSCSAGTPASFTVPVGGTVTCSFTNTAHGQLKIVKNAIGGNGTFKFTVTGPTSSTPSITTAQGTGTTGFMTVTAGSYSVSENATTGWVQSSAVCDSGTPGSFAITAGGQVTCTFTNANDADRDGIPDALDCNPTVKDTAVVDPGNLVPASFTGIRVSTLQAAVIAAGDKAVISMYADTVENVVIGAATGSGGKDLLIVGCGHKVSGQSATLPVIRIQQSAGRNDGAPGIGKPAQERDVQIVDLDVTGGSVGYLVETAKPATGGTDTLLKAVRAERNSVGIKIVGAGNEVRGANGVNDNGGTGIDVTGNANLIADTRVHHNAGAGVRVQGDGNLLKTNKVGDAGSGNKGDGISVAGSGNTIQENDVFASAGAGIVVAGSGNQLLKNDVGDTGKGNAGVGITITGDGNTLGKATYENNVFANGGAGMVVTGNNNLLVKNDVGDRGKGNGGDGMRVTGYGNTIQENSVFANAGEGITVAGGTSARPNLVLKNTVGDRSKGNGGNGITVASLGNGNTTPAEIEQNTVKSNKLDGIRVLGAGHQLKNNLSGGTGAFPGGDDNGQCEFNVGAGNFNTTGNKANGATIAGSSGTAFPATCQGTR